MHPVLFHVGALLIPSYGAMAAVGVLAALVLAQRTARVAGVHAGQMWNLSVVAVCAALVSERLLLVAANWSALRSHPAWMLGLGMIHHPLVAGAGAAAGLGCAAWYARMHRMPLLATADALAAPLSVGLTFEQLGTLLAGSGYGTAATVPWSATYTSPLAALWSGTPLGMPLHPVQAYAALGFLALAVAAVAGLPARRQTGDVAGMWLMGAGVAIYVTEMWRDPEGRGAVLRGALDGPQIAAVAMLLAGALVLRERAGAVESSGFPPFPPQNGGKDGAPTVVLREADEKDESGALPPFRQESAAADERMGHGESSVEKQNAGPSTRRHGDSLRMTGRNVARGICDASEERGCA